MNPHVKLAQFGKELLKHGSLEEAIPLISEYAKELSGAKRCSIYIYDNDTKELWTTLADGIEKIHLKADEGIAGHTLQKAQPILENTPYKNPSFKQDVDKESGFITENIASLPIFDSTRRVIGILQLLNKKEGFDTKDLRTMTFFAHYVSSYLELAIFYERNNASLLE